MSKTNLKSVFKNIAPAVVVMAAGLTGAFMVYDSYVSNDIGMQFAQIEPAAGPSAPIVEITNIESNDVGIIGENPDGLLVEETVIEETVVEGVTAAGTVVEQVTTTETSIDGSVIEQTIMTETGPEGIVTEETTTVEEVIEAPAAVVVPAE